MHNDLQHKVIRGYQPNEWTAQAFDWNFKIQLLNN